MIRSALCCAALFGVGSLASAGELDKEVKAPPAGTTASPAKLAGSELDAESPTDAWHRRGYWGHHHHHHHYGHRGYYGGFGGYAGYGYSPIAYRPAYYTPYYSYAGYRGFSGGFGYGFRGGYVGFGYGGW